MSNAYARDRDKVAKNVVALREALQRLGRPERGGSIAPEQLDRIAERLLREVDQLHGGIGTAPKFPQTGILELLWRAWKRTGQAPYRDAVVKALDAMCQGGIYDHLGGGFSRYSTDARWLVPHFEKMLYDNAELVDLLTLVWQETRRPALSAADRGDARLGRARDADTERAGLPAASTPTASTKKASSTSGPKPRSTRCSANAPLCSNAITTSTRKAIGKARTILNRLEGARHSPMRKPSGSSQLAGRSCSGRAKARVRPGLDDKVLADWNGLMIAAMANAGIVFERPAWIETGARRPSTSSAGK